MIFIPRVGLNVTHEILEDVFRNLCIGHIISADFNRKRGYQCVFIEMDDNYNFATIFEKFKGKLMVKFENNNTSWEIMKAELVYSA